MTGEAPAQEPESHSLLADTLETMTVAQRIKDLRRAKGLSQGQLAGAELSASYVSLLESGKRTPTTAALSVLAKRLDTTVAYLSTGQLSDPETNTKLELAYAELALANGDAEDAKQKISKLDTADMPAPLQSAVQLVLATCHEALGELEEAAAILEQVAEATVSRQEWLRHATAAMALVGCYLESGDLNRAVDVGDAALQRLSEVGLQGSDEGIRLAATVIWALHERGDLLFAQIRAAELCALAEAEGSPRARASIYWNAAMVAQSRGKDEEALQLTQRALGLFAEEANSRDMYRLRVHYAGLLLDGAQPDPEEALKQLDAAMPQLRESSSVVDMAYCAVEQARALVSLGRIDAAERAAEQSLRFLGDQPRLEACHARLVLGDIAWVRGDRAAARLWFHQAADTLGMMQSSRAASAAWRKLGDRLKEANEFEEALSAYDKALSERGLPPSLLSATRLVRATEQPG